MPQILATGMQHRSTCQPEASCSGRTLTAGPIPQRALASTTLLRGQRQGCFSRQQNCKGPQRVAAGVFRCGPGSLEQGQDRSGEYSSGRGDFSSSLRVPTTGMASLKGSMGGVTLERSKLDLRQKVQTQEPKLSNDGGGGGIGNKIFNGGGGDGDDGDDDDYFNFDGGDGDGDESFWRTAVGELYDEASLKAVLGEWFRTFGDLPLMIRQSVELGLFSSAQLVRFLCMDVRPGLTRKVTRVLSPKAARGVVGRLMADPAFMQKLFIEELVTGALSILYEAQQRGENFVRELDLVALNTLSLMGATGAMVYLTAPSRSYGAVHKFPWQNALHNLPNHVFDANTPYRRYSLVSRAASLFTKAAELCAVGSVTGATQSLGGGALVKLHQLRDPAFTPTLPVPELKRASGGNAAYMGSLANCRYQIVSGIDRVLFDRMKLLPIYLAASSLLRAGSQVFAHKSRVFATGLPTTAPVRQAAAPQLKVRKVRKVKRKVKKQPQSGRPQPEGQRGSNQPAYA